MRVRGRQGVIDSEPYLGEREMYSVDSQVAYGLFGHRFAGGDRYAKLCVNHIDWDVLVAESVRNTGGAGHEVLGGYRSIESDTQRALWCALNSYDPLAVIVEHGTMEEIALRRQVGGNVGSDVGRTAEASPCRLTPCHDEPLDPSVGISWFMDRTEYVPNCEHHLRLSGRG